MCPTPWLNLGDPEPSSLGEARRLLHQAAQLAAAPAQHLLPRRPDDSQMALAWEDGCFLGEALPSGHRVALRLVPLALELRGPGGTVALPLEGLDADSALGRLKEALAREGVEAGALSLAMPYEVPPLPAGTSFAGGPAVAELARWFADAARLLADYAALPGASPLRCWPHHFDLATLISLEDGDPEHARSLGLGLSPGDEGLPEPYLYVTPWPYPKAPKPPALPSGRWNLEPWFGAVLRASELVQAPDQAVQASAFLRAAHQACKAMLAEASASAGSPG